MNNLKQLLRQPLRQISSSTAVWMFIIATIGFADATYLTVEHFLGVLPPCNIHFGCDLVLTSKYSEIFGMPVSLFGSIYYLMVMSGVLAYFETRKGDIFKWTLYMTSVGFLASIWFLCLQAFVIHSYCMYCLGSIATSTILFAIAKAVFIKNLYQKPLR